MKTMQIRDSIQENHHILVLATARAQLTFPDRLTILRCPFDRADSSIALDPRSEPGEFVLREWFRLRGLWLFLFGLNHKRFNTIPVDVNVTIMGHKTEARLV